MARASSVVCSLAFVVGLVACGGAGSEPTPDTGDAVDPLAPTVAGTIALTGDGEVESASSLELRFTHTSSPVEYFSQSHSMDDVEFPFDFEIGGGLADPADEWELVVWLSWSDGSESAPQPGAPSASITIDFSDCSGEACQRRDDIDLILDTSTE